MDKYRILVKGIVQCQDHYLVVEKWYDDRIFDPYQWEFIDGTIEFSETPEKAVQRVVEEKTGLSVLVDKPLYTWDLPLEKSAVSELPLNVLPSQRK